MRFHCGRSYPVHRWFRPAGFVAYHGRFGQNLRFKAVILLLEFSRLMYTATFSVCFPVQIHLTFLNQYTVHYLRSKMAYENKQVLFSEKCLKIKGLDSKQGTLDFTLNIYSNFSKKKT